MFGVVGQDVRRILIGIDKDGTLIDDTGSFPGSKWPDTSDLVLRPGVLEGMIMLRQEMPEAKLVIISNASGPARKKIRAEDLPYIYSHVNTLLNPQTLDGIYWCEHVTQEYAEHKLAQGKTIDWTYVRNCPDMKPCIGQLERAAREMFACDLKKCCVYMIGDRPVDVHTGFNAGGVGVFVPSEVEEHSDVLAAQALHDAHPNKVYLASNFLDGAKWVVRHSKRDT